MSYPDCLDFVLQREGGWSNNPADTGGCTMHGITLPVYRVFKHNASLTCSDLAQITDSDVSGVYVKLYWAPIGGDQLPAGIALSVFDMAVNAGVSASAKLLQGVLGTNVDGVIGAHTIACLLKLNAMQVIDALTTAQGAYYRTRGNFAIFGEGWLNRLADREAAALKLACAVPVPTTQMMVATLRRQAQQPMISYHPTVMPWTGSMVRLPSVDSRSGPTML